MRGRCTRLPAETPPEGGESAEAIVSAEGGEGLNIERFLKLERLERSTTKADNFRLF